MDSLGGPRQVKMVYGWFENMTANDDDTNGTLYTTNYGEHYKSLLDRNLQNRSFRPYISSNQRFRLTEKSIEPCAF